MKKLAVAVLVVLALSGCARVQYALEMMPQRAEDAFNDPVRRTHLVTQVGRVAGSASLAIMCFGFVPPPFSLGVCPIVAVVADFVNFEFILEPLSKQRVQEGKPSLVGAYWETGPRSDEGEVFSNP